MRSTCYSYRLIC